MGRLLSDPDTLRQMAQVMSNPVGGRVGSWVGGGEGRQAGHVHCHARHALLQRGDTWVHNHVGRHMLTHARLMFLCSSSTQRRPSCASKCARWTVR